jgi:hypothetical protein
MNTPQITQNTTDEQMVQSLNTGKAIVTGSADKPEDTIIIHEAKIITPQPYGIYALCKIYEHLQIN